MTSERTWQSQCNQNCKEAHRQRVGAERGSGRLPQPRALHEYKRRWRVCGWERSIYSCKEQGETWLRMDGQPCAWDVIGRRTEAKSLVCLWGVCPDTLGQEDGKPWKNYKQGIDIISCVIESHSEGGTDHYMQKRLGMERPVRRLL